MSQKSEINKDAANLEKKIRAYCLAQKERWHKLLILARKSESSLLAIEMRGMELVASHGLYRVWTGEVWTGLGTCLFIDLEKARFVTLYMGQLGELHDVFKATRSQVIAISSNINAIDAETILTRAYGFLESERRRSRFNQKKK